MAEVQDLCERNEPAVIPDICPIVISDIRETVIPAKAGIQLLGNAKVRCLALGFLDSGLRRNDNEAIGMTQKAGMMRKS